LRAVVLREVGGELAVEELPEPEGEHVLTVRAAGVNFADVLVRHGHYPQMPDLPHVLGNEVSGELDGRRVVAFPRSAGGYAERVEIDPDWVLTLPEHASYAAGAAFFTTYLTAHIPLVHQLHITETSVVLVHAGSGGVGTAAIQLAKNLGATVIATASTDEKRAFARTVGADQAIGYDELEGLRVDAVIDPLGGEVFKRSLPLLNPLGTIVAIGYIDGLWEDQSVQWLVGRNATVAGFYLGRLLRLRPDLVRAAADELLDLWADRKIDPVVGHRFPLQSAQEAHELIESRRHVGKVVLEP
jgi:NADPH2:quinone reductase